jgi:hypothetical protein
MNFFLVSDDESEDDNAVGVCKKIISQAVKDGKLNLLEYSYLLDYFDTGGTLVNASWFLNLTNKINDTELTKITINKYGNLFSESNDKLLKLKSGLSKKLIKEKKNVIEFTKDQKSAIKKICRFLPDFEQKIFGLYGYAGTGKTTTVVEIVTYLLKHKIIHSVVFTAPTNKAVNVIKSRFRMYLKELSEQFLAKDLPEQFSFEDVIDELYKKGVQIDFTTIHKLLKFESDFNSDGDVIFIRGDGDSLISKYELVIIDECSMIPLKIINQILIEIRTALNKTSNNYKKVPKIIFSGDPAQLPPVSEKKSAIFMTTPDDLSLHDYVKAIYDYDEAPSKTSFKNKSDNSEYLPKYQIFVNDIIKMPCITLKKVMRSKLDVVTNVCYQIRRWAIGEVTNPELGDFTNCKGVYFYQYDKTKKKIGTEWFKTCLKYFENEKLCNIILTWTNPQANEYNQAIRSAIFKKEKLNRFEINDILMFSEFYNIVESGDKFQTSEQIKILKIEQIDKPLTEFNLVLDKKAQKLKNGKIYESKYVEIIRKIHEITQKSCLCWKLTVTRFGDHDTQNATTILVIHETQEKNLMNDKDMVANCVKTLRRMLINKFKDKANQIDNSVIKPFWRQWHKRYIEPFASVNYGYAITCHKGQGSNFYNVFVDIDDIGKNINYDETKHCIYTAVTRTSNELHLLLS